MEGSKSISINIPRLEPRHVTSIQLQGRLGNVFSLCPQKQENKVRFANEWGFREAHQRAKYVSPRIEGTKEAGVPYGQKRIKTDTTKDQLPRW